MPGKCIAVCILLLLAVFSAKAQVLTIDSCYALALRNYPLIKQYELIEKSRDYTLSNASKAYLPQLSITAIEGYVFGGLPQTGEGGGASSSDFKFIGLAQLNQLIWDGGATKTQKNIINASSETERASVAVALNELRTRVNQLYFGVLMIDEQLSQLEVRDAILKNNVDRIRQLKDNGLAYSTDLDELRVEQIRLNQQRTEFNYTRDGYVEMLSLLTGQKIGSATKFQKPVLNSPVADLQLNRPELSLYQSQRNLINAQSEMRKVALMPKLGLLGAGVLISPGVSLGPSTLNSIGVAGLSASWNISGLYRNSNDKNLTIQALNKIDVQEETFLFNTKTQLTQTSANIEKQRAILKEDEEIILLRKKIRENQQLKYNTGTGPLFDLLNATEKEGEAKTQKAMHEMQLLMTLYEYKTITGNQ